MNLELQDGMEDSLIQLKHLKNASKKTDHAILGLLNSCNDNKVMTFEGYLKLDKMRKKAFYDLIDAHERLMLICSKCNNDIKQMTTRKP
jgi:hypothetical protein